MNHYRLYVVRLSEKFRKSYSKSLHLEPNLFEIIEFSKGYDEYVEPSLLYFTQDLRETARALGVKRIIPKGQYIMGLLGGEKKKGQQRHAGLVLEEYRHSGGEFAFRLHGTSRKMTVPASWMEKYGVDIYELIYVGMINPFRLNRSLPVLLSSCGTDKLREFLEIAVKTNASALTSNDVDRIKTLIGELKQPSNLEVLDVNSYYAVYRCDRAFTACFIRPRSRTILDSHVSALECSSEDEAYYYVGVLNSMVYKVIASGRGFIHHQFARPALAIVIAGLSLKDVDEDIRMQVAELSSQLKQRVPATQFSNQKEALKNIAKYEEFERLITVLDKIVEKERLNKALDMVSGAGSATGEG